MNIRKVAGLLAGLGLAAGLLGTGVGAQFTDGVTGQQNINVGTFGCVITGATSGAQIAGDHKSVTYNSPTIQSSAPGNSPFSFTVHNSGTIAAKFTVTASSVLGTSAAPFSAMAITPASMVMPVAGGADQVFGAGIQWTELTNAQLHQSYTINYTVSCGEVPYGAANLTAAACGNGTLVIDATEAVLNDVDSGFGGNWAMDSYNRQIQVWQTAPGQFCASLSYTGGFLTFGPTSPSGTGTVSAGVQGSMTGGYLATFTGVLLGVPAWPTSGSVGTVDYQCNQSGSTCVYVSWLDKYFASNAGFNMNWWGWQYAAGSHGTWVNAIAGSSGDITG